MHLDVDDILGFVSNNTISIGLDSLDLDPKIYQIQMFICLLFSNTHHSRSRHSFCEVAGWKTILLFVGPGLFSQPK